MIGRAKRPWSIPALILLLSCICFPPGAASGAAAQESRGYASFDLELDGVYVGFLYNSEGGSPSSAVIIEPMGPNYIIKKHLGQPRYEDIVINVGPHMSKHIYEWIKDTITQRYQPKNGAIVLLDQHYRELSRLEFFNALITEVTFPILDASSRDLAYLQVKISPSFTRSRRYAGSAPVAYAHAQTAAQQQRSSKKWSSSNYRFTIACLENAARGIHKISALTYKIQFQAQVPGGARDAQPYVGYDLSNITVWVAGNHAEPFYQWFDDFVVKGNNADNMERTATLEYFDARLSEVLFKLTLSHVGIYKMSAEKATADSFQLHKAELYIENIFNFEYPH